MSARGSRARAGRWIRASLAAAGAALLAACADAVPPPPPPGAIPAGSVIGSSSIRGRAIFAGEAPAQARIVMDSDPVCAARGKGKLAEEVVIGPEGSLANVFVRIESGLGERIFAPPETPAILDQDGCAYSPHVLGVQVNQVLEIVNSDPTMHNVHSLPADNEPFNVGMAIQGQRIRRFFSHPEVMVRIKCDLHNWMAAWVGVVEHPFFDVTGPDGTWSIEGLPAGRYRVAAWHERFGIHVTEIELEEGESESLSFEFSP